MEIKIKPSFLADPVVLKLFSLFVAEKAELYIVGGAVRDSLKGKEVGDLDFATNLSPKSMLSLFVKYKIKAIPTGGAHGTITVVIHKRSFEITPYRSDVETDGRHAKVAFVPSLEKDALRRDFTINSLYLDQHGNLLDFVGGYADLKAGIVRFIGNPDKRIKEDYLRILRFFRFSAAYANSLDPESFAACIKHKDGLNTLSRERVLDEILKIMCVPEPAFVLSAMFDSGIFGVLFHACPFSKDVFQKFVSKEPYLDPLRRLFLILPNAATCLPLSNQQKKRFKTLEKLLASPKPLYDILYYHGKESAEDFLFISEATGKDIFFSWKDINKAVAFLPDFPIRGEDLMKRGFEGSAIGAEIKRLEKKWLNSKCILTKKDLLHES